VYFLHPLDHFDLVYLLGHFVDFHQKIKGVSLSNNNGSQDQHLPISSGILKYRDVVQSILDCNWKGLVAFETRGIETKDALAELENIYFELLQIRK
jgi:endonuclease IV